MPRQARRKCEYSTYHVMLRGNERKDIFNSEEDRYKFLEILGKIKDRYNLSINAYCLMDNHVHLMINDNGNDISQIMKSLSVSFVMYYNRKYNRTGHLLQDRFLSEIILDDRYMLQASKYIHNNPVKAGIVSRPEEYRWSSYNIYLGTSDNKLSIDKAKILDYLSSDMQKAVSEYRKFVSQEEGGIIKFLDMDSGIPEKRTEQSYIWTLSQAEERLREILQKQNKTTTDLRDNKVFRDDTIKMISENSSLTLKEIGQIFGGISESRISRILKGKRQARTVPACPH